MLASGSSDETIKLWKISDGSLIRNFTGHVSWVKLYYKCS
jgi:WD40 repeat protein